MEPNHSLVPRELARVNLTVSQDRMNSQSPSRSPKKKMCNAIFITLSNGKKVSYLHTISESKKNSPTVLFIHGRGGSIHSLRSECVERYCKQNDISFFAFDLLGHGNSDGEKSEILISDWVAQIHEVIDIFYKQLSVSPDTDKMLICGYSMGGYLTCLALRKKKILGKIDSVLL